MDEYNVRKGVIDKGMHNGQEIDLDDFDFSTPDRKDMHIYLKPDELKQRALAAMDDGESDDDWYDSEDEDDGGEGLEDVGVAELR